MLQRLEIILLVLGLLIAAGLAWLDNSTWNAKVNTTFERLTEDEAETLDRRMQKYLQALIATGAYVRGTPTFSEAQFEQFVEDLEIDMTLPGINGIGMIEAVEADQLDAFENRIRASRFPQFRVYPATETAQKLVIRRVSPLASNKEALGLDISFEQHRREAALRARDQNVPALTGAITLVQDQEQLAGFLLLLPLDIAGPDTWVYAPFVARALFGVSHSQEMQPYVMEVFDASTTDQAHKIYSNNHRYTQDQLQNNPETGQHKHIQQVSHFGREWTLSFSSTAHFDATYRDHSSTWILVVGIVLTVMLTTMLRNMRMRNTALAQIAVLRDRQIKAQEQENRSIVENAVTPFFILDRADRILFANQAACDCFGFTDDEMNDKPFGDLVTIPAQSADHAIGTTKSGEALILDLQRNSWSTDAGAPRVTAIVRDITAEQTAQQAIYRTKTLYDLALQGSRIGVFDVNLETGISEVSDTWCRIMGYTGDFDRTAAQSDFTARVHPDDLEQLKATDAACIAGLTDRSTAEYRLRTVSGAWRWMRSDAVVSKRTASGRALRLIGTQMDVTEEHRARNALEASESQLRQTLAATPIGTVIFDETGVFIGCNAAFETLVGMPDGTLSAGHRIYDFVYRDDMEKIFAAMASVDGQQHSEVYKAEHPLLCQDGHERLGLFHVSCTLDKNTDRWVYIVQIIDITEQRRVEKLKDEFVSTVSHELRTPLTSIKGALGLMQATEASGSNTRLLEIASSNADRLTAIVNDILDLEKISSGALTFDLGNIDICAAINKAVETLQPFALGHDNTLQAVLPDTPLMVTADLSRMQQVLANLISNACKYSHADTAVHVRVTTDTDFAKVQVSNIGDGVPADFRPHVFDAFSQADGSDTRAKGGTGLGLNITRQIVERHRGEIGFDTTRGGETVFWFTCPLAHSETNHTTTSITQQPINASYLRPRVLHLEDDADFAAVVRAGLSVDADVMHARSLAQADCVLNEWVLDAIVLDWHLPDGDAETLLDRINTLHPAARIVALSAAADQRDDPRLTANIVKTRAEMSDIRAAVLGPQETETFAL